MTAIGAEQDVVDAWVKATLVAHGGLNTAYPGLTTRIFDRFAPTGTAYPYIVFQDQSPVRDIIGVGPARVLVETLYVVKAIAQCVTYAPLREPAHEIDLAMTVPNGSALPDGALITSIRQEGFSLVEVENEVQYRHLGGVYRIQASVPA
jgi:hypothetical protein